MISWEAVTAVSTAISAIVIAATVVVGYRQLVHLRRATQLDGTLKIFDEIARPEMRAARRFILRDLPERMKDPHFRAEVATMAAADESVHPEMHILREYEKIGTYVRFGYLDADVLCDYAGPVVRDTWETLHDAGVIALHRENFGDTTLWENYEFLYGAVCEYEDRHGNVYGHKNRERLKRSRELFAVDKSSDSKTLP